MLHEFLTKNRAALIERCRAKVALRSAPKATAEQLEHGIPVFLTELVHTLETEGAAALTPALAHAARGPGALPAAGKTAAHHGRDLFEQGFTIEQVVHDYGDICQAITDLAVERRAPIEVDEFRTLNRCLDLAIAEAVTEFAYQREMLVAEQHGRAMQDLLGGFAHELRTLVGSATLALTAIKSGNVGIFGATGAVLDRSLVGLRHLTETGLMELRLAAGSPINYGCFSLADLVAEVKLSASLEARFLDCGFQVSEVDPRLAVDADRDMLLAAVGNLLESAFKSRRPPGEVALSAYALGDRIVIDIEGDGSDMRGSPVDARLAALGSAFEDPSAPLAIARRSIEANDGSLNVSVKGAGCLFRLELPRHAMPERVLG